MFVSYAQNFEDVILWRALGGVVCGTYIDVGAQDPIVDSVTQAFYERGWRGVHVEAEPSYAQKLREQRPGDLVLEAAVGEGYGLVRFYAMPGTGISTCDQAIAERHKERGVVIHELVVPSVPLSAVFEACDADEIHWLKIDIEGREEQALASWGDNERRPWIVVVEATLPLTQVDSHSTWEAMLLQRGYVHVYFDGLNRYYLSTSHPELAASFATPPNVFDDFAVNGTASTSLHRLLESRHDAAIGVVRRQASEAEAICRDESERMRRLAADAEARVHAAEAAHETTSIEHAQSLARAELRGERAALRGALRVERARRIAATQAEQARLLAGRMAELDRRAQAARQERGEFEEKVRRDVMMWRMRVESAESAGTSAVAETSRINLELVETRTRLRTEAMAAAVRVETAEAHGHRLRYELEKATAAAVSEQVRHTRLEVVLAEREKTAHAQQHRLRSELDALAARLEAQLEEALAVRAHFEKQVSTFSDQRRKWSEANGLLVAVDAELSRAPRVLSPRSRRLLGRIAGSVSVLKELTASIPADGAPDKFFDVISQRCRSQEKSVSPQVSSIYELLSLQDALFVDAAYRGLLGREAEAEGRAAYLRQVRDGVSREEIVRTLATSEEGRRANRSLVGLQALLDQPVTQPSLLQRWIRRMWMLVWQDAERQMRRLENLSYRLAFQQTQRLERLEMHLLDLSSSHGATVEDTQLNEVSSVQQDALSAPAQDLRLSEQQRLILDKLSGRR